MAELEGKLVTDDLNLFWAVETAGNSHRIPCRNHET